MTHEEHIRSFYLKTNDPVRQYVGSRRLEFLEQSGEEKYSKLSHPQFDFLFSDGKQEPWSKNGGAFLEESFCIFMELKSEKSFAYLVGLANMYLVLFKEQNPLILLKPSEYAEIFAARRAD